MFSAWPSPLPLHVLRTLFLWQVQKKKLNLNTFPDITWQEVDAARHHWCHHQRPGHHTPMMCGRLNEDSRHLDVENLVDWWCGTHHKVGHSPIYKEGKKGNKKEKEGAVFCDEVRWGSPFEERERHRADAHAHAHAHAHGHAYLPLSPRSFPLFLSLFFPRGLLRARARRHSCTTCTQSTATTRRSYSLTG